MPDLDLSPEDVGPDRTRAALAYIEAVMLAPDDPSERQRILAASMARFTRDSVFSAIPDGIDGVTLSPTALISLVGMLEAAPTISDVQSGPNGVQARFRDGAIAGEALRRLLGLRSLGSPHGRIGIIKKKIAEEWKISAAQFDNDIWKKFKPVSHLWASYINRAINSEEIRYPFPCMLSDLELFLSEAERMRMEAETMTHEQSSSKVLDAETTWKVPSTISLPVVNAVQWQRVDRSGGH